MSIITPNDRAINAANNLLNLANQLESLLQQCSAYSTQYTEQSWTTVWSALTTTATNADGTLGTVDGSPNTAHVIDTRVYPTLNKAVSETQLANAFNAIGAFVTLMTGGAASQFNYQTQLNAVVA